MIFLAVITLIVLTVFIVNCIQWNSEEETYGFGMFCGISIAILFAIEILCICEIMSKSRPKAMDVYQGKTTIEYIIRDGVDSVVVFK